MKHRRMYALGMHAAAMAVVLMPLAVAAQPAVAGQLYEVTLRDTAMADEPEGIAADLAATHGGSVVDVRDGRVTLRLAPTRARVVAVDPRVARVVPHAGAAAHGSVAANAETMTWSTGVVYTYDGSGNVRQIGGDFFVYDAVSRLVQSDANGVRRNYEYDAYGNRTRCVQSAGTMNEADCQVGYTIDPETNRIAAGATYDAAGNVTVLAGHAHTYDALNMETRDDWGRLAREYIYTADDERIAVYDVGSSWRWTVRDTSGKVLREFTSSDGANGSVGTANWKWSKDYIWRDGLLLASRQVEPGGASPVTYHYHLDHLGTPRRITDGADRIRGVHDYHAFGQEASGGQNEPSLSLLKFTGHERDLWGGSESWDTLDYMHARFYMASVGRFLSVDPGKDWDPRQAQSWNLYTYVRNNPINRVDPTGRCGEKPEFIGPAVPCAKGQDSKPQQQQNEPRTVKPEPAGGPPVPVPGAPDADWKFNPNPENKRGGSYGPNKPIKGQGQPSGSWEGGATVPHWDIDDGLGDRRRYDENGNFITPEQAHGKPVKRTTALSAGEVMGAIGLAIFGTAITIMTGGGAALQPSPAGVLIVPTTTWRPQDLDKECPTCA